MKCPVCTTADLMMTERQGVEIDYCPQCRGVWLDRGELDKIIDRASEQPERQPSAVREDSRPQERPPDPGYRRDYDDDDHRRKYGDDDYYRRKKKRGFLGEIFDFD